MDIGTAKPDAADARARPASPDRHRRSDRGVFGGALSCATRSRRSRPFARAARAAPRRRHDALFQGADRGTVRAAAGRSPPCARASTRGPRAEGWPALHAELARVDPATAARLAADRRAAHPARARSARGRPGSRCRRCRARASARARSARRSRSRSFPPIARGCTRRSPSASTRCSRRASSTSSRALRARYRARRRTCRRCAASATGRRGQFLDGRIDAASAARATAIAATRQLAKRQFTWLRATPARAFDPAMPTSPMTRRRTFLLREGAVRAALTARLLLCNNPSLTARRRSSRRRPPTMHARTLYDKLWDSHVVRDEADGTALHLHRPPPRARGDEPAGVRRPAARRPQAVARAIDRRHRRPQHADQGLGRGHPRSDLAHAGRDARRQHRASTARRRISRFATGARASSTSSAPSRARRCPE